MANQTQIPQWYLDLQKTQPSANQTPVSQTPIPATPPAPQTPIPGQQKTEPIPTGYQQNPQAYVAQLNAQPTPPTPTQQKYQAPPAGTQTTQPKIDTQTQALNQQAKSIQTALQAQPEALSQPDQVRSIADTTSEAQKQMDELQGLLQQKMDSFMNPSSQQQTYQDYYNQLASQQGLPALDMQAINLQNIIAGTEDDIRNEIKAGGGFADESQVAALAATRNKVLTNELNSLNNLRQYKSDWINNQMSLYKEDQTTAANNFDKLFGYADKVASLQNTIDNSGFKNTLAYWNYQQKQQTQDINQLKFLSSQGSLGSLSDSDIEYYSQSLGIDPQTIKDAATNSDAKWNLDNQLLIKKAQAASAAGQLSPDAQMLLANMYLTTGQMPALGMGSSGTRVSILNQAASMANSTGMTAGDLASNSISYAANKTALGQVQKNYSLSQAAEAKVMKNFDMLSQYSSKVSRTDSPLVNNALLYWKGQIQGDPETIAFVGLLKTTADEYAKIVFANLGSSGVTDNAAKQLNDIMFPALSKGQLNKVIATMKQEVDNTMYGYQKSISDIKSSLSQVSAQNPIPASQAPTDSALNNWLSQQGL